MNGSIYMTNSDKTKKNLNIFGKTVAKSLAEGVMKGSWHLGKRIYAIGKEGSNFVNAVHQDDSVKRRKAIDNLVDEIFTKPMNSAIDIAEKITEVAFDTEDCIFEDDPNKKDKKVQKTIVKGGVLTGAIAAGFAIGDAAGDIIIDNTTEVHSFSDIPELVHMQPFLPNVDVNTVSGIEDYFVHNNADINALSALGMKSELINNHIDSDFIERSESVKIKFLHSIGRTEIPDGYEIHHIVPLSQGGLDDPRNMVLISEKDHDYITNQHRKFYNW